MAHARKKGRPSAPGRPPAPVSAELEVGVETPDSAVDEILNRDAEAGGDQPIKGFANGIVAGAVIWAVLILVYLLLT